MKSALQEMALFILDHEYIVPLSAVPLFLMLRIACRGGKGSLLVFSLSLPGIVYPLGLLGAQDVLYAMIVWSIVLPQIWIIPLIAAASAIRLWLIVHGRLEDPLFRSFRTIAPCVLLAGLYASPFWERYLLMTSSW
jgi:hypothetical protein